jgi:predicted esterase
VNPGVPLTPDKALAYSNIKEVGSTNAVAGVNAPIYVSFSSAVDPTTVNSATVKVFQVLADATPTENTALGFKDVSGLFAYSASATSPNAGVLAGGKEALLFPKLPLLPGTKYLYVVTNGVKDTLGQPIGNSITFGFLKYVKPGGTSAATDTTNLGDLLDPNNPAILVGQTSATSLEQIRGNRLLNPAAAYDPTTNPVLLSGYGKVMWDLIASAGADTSGKAGATATSISGRNQIVLLGRFITTGAGAIVPNPAAPNSRIPVETALWAWANNANVAPLGVDFSGAESRAWANGAAGTTVYNATSTPTLAQFYGALPAPLNTAPRASIGAIVTGTFESGDLNMDPAVVSTVTTATPSTSGNLTTGAPATLYNPGNAAVPGTGVLQASRGTGGNLRGFYHVTRNVPFIMTLPSSAVPTNGFPVLIFLHGIGGQKEQMLAMANAAAAAGFATIAIDQPLHGALANGRASSEWGSNFISLPSILNTRTNIQQGGFNLWRMERMLKQPSADPTSIQNAVGTAISGGKLDASTIRFSGLSLGSIVGSYFMAGNSSQTGGSNMRGFLSVPGGRIPYLLQNSPTFSPVINGGLAAAGVPTGSPAYNQFFVLAQNLIDPVDPATMTTPISSVAPSRLSGRMLVQEAIGDTVIPNEATMYYMNALAGRAAVGTEIAANFTHVFKSAQTSATVPFIFGPGFVGNKAGVAAAISTSTSPTEGVFQFGSAATPATHGMLLDASANTPAAQRQLATWLATGLVTDGADTGNGFPIAPPPPNAPMLLGHESLRVFAPAVSNR